MTPAQRKLLDFIVDYQNANGGVTPTYQQMAAHIGGSTGNAHYIVDRLVEQGRAVRRGGRQSRAGIDIVHDRATLYAVSTDDLLTELHSRDVLARAA